MAQRSRDWGAASRVARGWRVWKIPLTIEAREVMNIREASHYLGVSPDTLYRYIYEDRIPAFKLGNRWKFKKTVLDRWMEKKSERVLEVKSSRVEKVTVKS